MGLAVAFIVVIAITLAMLVGAMYFGGGAEAVRRQAGIVVLMALLLSAIALVVFIAANVQGGMLPLGVAAAVLSSIIAATFAHSLGSQSPRLATFVWLIAAFEAVLALVAIVLLLA